MKGIKGEILVFMFMYETILRVIPSPGIHQPSSSIYVWNITVEGKILKSDVALLKDNVYKKKKKKGLEEKGITTLNIFGLHSPL